MAKEQLPTFLTGAPSSQPTPSPLYAIVSLQPTPCPTHAPSLSYENNKSVASFLYDMISSTLTNAAPNLVPALAIYAIGAISEGIPTFIDANQMNLLGFSGDS